MKRLLLSLVCATTMVSCGQEGHELTLSTNSTDTVPETQPTQVSHTPTTSNPQSSSSTQPYQVKWQDRITPQDLLSDAEYCKHKDKTSNDLRDSRRYGWAYTSGFPRPSHLPDPTLDLQVLIVPISTSDSRFTEYDIKFVDDGMELADSYFRDMSFGKVGISYEIAPERFWVNLEGTLESEGLYRPTDQSLPGEDGVPHTDLSDNIIQYLREASSKIDVSTYDIVGIVSSWDADFYAGHVYGPPEGIETESGTIYSTFFKGGRAISNPSAWVHEFGHAWLGFEDLYDLRDFNIVYLGRWDMMEWAGGAAEFNAWMRWRSGWIDDDQIRCLALPVTSTHFIEAVHINSRNSKGLVIPLDEYRVLFVESHRVNLNNSVLNSAIIYEIDTNYWSGQGPFRLVGKLDEIDTLVRAYGYDISLVDRDSTGDLIEVTVS